MTSCCVVTGARVFGFVVDLLKRESPVGDCYRAAQLWEWAGVDPSMTPIGVSHFGDLFLAGADGAWFVDLLRGTVTREWSSRQDLFEVLGSRTAQDRFLRVFELRRIVADGRTIDSTQVLVPDLPTSLEGSLDPTEVKARPILTAHGYFAQLRQRIRELKPGVAVCRITTDEQGVVSLATGPPRNAATASPGSARSGVVRVAISAMVLDRYGQPPLWLVPPPSLTDFSDGEGIAAVHAGRYWHLISSAVSGAGVLTHGAS